MNIDYKYINNWLTERAVTLKPGFSELLKAYASIYEKNIN